MLQIISKKRAISTVLTTVIILVSSVVLGAGVVLYGSSLFQGGTQTEAIRVSDAKLWVHANAPDGLSWGAVGVRNTGDKVVSIDKIQPRGSDIPFEQWYADNTINDPAIIQAALNHTGWSGIDGKLVDQTNYQNAGCNPGFDLTVDLDGVGTTITECIEADAATGPISLDPGQAVIIYFQLTNGTITTLDTGVQTNVGIYAGKAGAPFSVIVQGVE